MKTDRPKEKKGWHGYTFAYGRVEVPRYIPEQGEPSGPYDQEVLDYGCYHSTVDFEKLDQQ